MAWALHPISCTLHARGNAPTLGRVSFLLQPGGKRALESDAEPGAIEASGQLSVALDVRLYCYCAAAKLRGLFLCRLKSRRRRTTSPATRGTAPKTHGDIAGRKRESILKGRRSTTPCRWKS